MNMSKLRNLGNDTVPPFTCYTLIADIEILAMLLAIAVAHFDELLATLPEKADLQRHFARQAVRGAGEAGIVGAKAISTIFSSPSLRVFFEIRAAPLFRRHVDCRGIIHRRHDKVDSGKNAVWIGLEVVDERTPRRLNDADTLRLASADSYCEFPGR